MADSRIPIDEVIDRIAGAYEAGPVWDDVLPNPPLEIALSVVLDRLRKGKLSAKAAVYCVVGAHPIRNNRGDADRDVDLSAHFWRRWWQSPDVRKSRSRFISDDDPGYWRWDNGDLQRTGEVVGGITLPAAEADKLVQALSRLTKKGAGGRPPSYPHERAISAVTLRIAAFDPKEQAKLTGESVGAELKAWYDQHPQEKCPDVTMRNKQGSEILRSLKEAWSDEAGR